MNLAESLKNGFSISYASRLMRGFPSNWQSLLTVRIKVHRPLSSLIALEGEFRGVSALAAHEERSPRAQNPLPAKKQFSRQIQFPRLFFPPKNNPRGIPPTPHPRGNPTYPNKAANPRGNRVFPSRAFFFAPKRVDFPRESKRAAGLASGNPRGNAMGVS